jgi:cation diffusion facilitator CzcD-associated flavoprotein CzcO
VGAVGDDHVPHITERSPYSVIVIGAGISGILVAIKLLDAGITSFVILEKAADLGGTWRDNTYPGVSCDVATHLYVYSFAPNPKWQSRFTSGDKILEYYRRVARKRGIDRFIRFDEEVTRARWTGSSWHIHTSNGKELEAAVVITAVGRLHQPKFPEIQGLAEFGGPVIHTAQWDHSVETTGKRVGLIGNGSSGTQLTVALARSVARLTIFQRTPQWILPVPNEVIRRRKRLALRLIPGAARNNYTTLQRGTEERGVAAMGTKEQRRDRDQMCYDGLATVRDPDLRRKLTPDYEPGCKRMVISERFYEAVQEPAVEVVTEAIARVKKDAVITADGVPHELDVLVLATGFHAQAFLQPMHVVGEDGIALDDVWRQTTMNYRSVAIPHMPNLFMINGPYSPGGSASVVGIAEAQVGYVMQLVTEVLGRGITLSPDPDRSALLLDRVRQAAKETVWGTGGCSSWYLDDEGIPTINPVPLSELQRQMAKPDLDDFIVIPPRSG